jgi:cardiolipin synthase
MSATNLIFIFYQVTAILAVIHVVMDNRQPAKTVAWALVIYFVPIIGLLAYLFFGINTRRKRLVHRHTLDQTSRNAMLDSIEQHGLVLPEAHKSIIELFASQNSSLPFGQNKVNFMTSGYEFFPSLLRDIASAKSHIHIDIYIFEDDPLGQLVSDALISKARQGIEVRVIYDDVGCWSVSNRFFDRMEQAGIEVRPFLPVHFPRLTSKANYRNHRKIIVIDGSIGYIGGMNIALRYVNGGTRKNKKHLPWRDTMARIEGHGVYSLQQAFFIDWFFVESTLINDSKYYPGPTSGTQESSTLLQTVTSGPQSPMPEIMQGLVNIIMNAKRYVYIETPYFLPTSIVIFALKTAVSTGVDVRLLVPLNGDTWLTQWASRSYLREVAEAGVKVSLYKPAFLHSKMIVCDDCIATCGSTNIDFRSLENNFEANTFFYGAEAACKMRDIYLADEAESELLVNISGRMHPRFFVQLWESLTRLFSPLL